MRQWSGSFHLLILLHLNASVVFSNLQRRCIQAEKDVHGRMCSVSPVFVGPYSSC